MNDKVTITISAETVALIEAAFALTEFNGREAVRIKRRKARDEFYAAVEAARSAA